MGSHPRRQPERLIWQPFLSEIAHSSPGNRDLIPERDLTRICRSPSEIYQETNDLANCEVDTDFKFYYLILKSFFTRAVAGVSAGSARGTWPRFLGVVVSTVKTGWALSWSSYLLGVLWCLLLQVCLLGEFRVALPLMSRWASLVELWLGKWGLEYTLLLKKETVSLDMRLNCS